MRSNGRTLTSAIVAVLVAATRGAAQPTAQHTTQPTAQPMALQAAVPAAGPPAPLTLEVRVTDARTGAPVAGAVITVGLAKRIAALSQANGSATVADQRSADPSKAPSALGLTVERLGYRVARVSIAARQRVVTVQLHRLAWDSLLNARSTMAGCSVPFSDGEALWQQVRAELKSGQLGRGSRVSAGYLTRRWQIVNANQRADSARIQIMDAPLLPMHPEPSELFARGFVTSTPYSREFLAPNDLFFLDEAFTKHYCVSGGLGGGMGESSLLSVRFAPRKVRRNGSDIGGVFLIDTVRARLEMMQYDYLDLPDVAIERPRGAVMYARLSDGSAFPTSWSQGVPMPTLSGYQNPGDPRIDTLRRIFVRATVLWTGNTVDSVTWADGVTYRADSAMRARLSASTTPAGTRRSFEIDSNPARPLWGMLRGLLHFHPDLPNVTLDGASIVTLPSGRTQRAGYGGSFGYDELPANDTAIVIYQRGFLPYLHRFTSPPGRIEAKLESVTATQAPSVRTSVSPDGVARVVGAVGDTTLRPLIGARVRLIGHNAIARTDARGRFVIDARPGTYLLVIDHANYARQIVGVTVRTKSQAEVSAWMVPRAQAGAVVTDDALQRFEQRFEQRFAQRANNASGARRLLARDAFETSDSTLRAMKSVAELARAHRRSCLVQVEGAASAAVPANWIRPRDVELLEIESATEAHATCGNHRIRAWLRR